MLKYSFMSFSTPEMGWADMLNAAAELGYDGVEPRLDAGHAHGAEASADADGRDAIREQAAQAGVAIACLATSLRFANPAEQEDTLAAATERINLAGDLGAPAIRVFGGRVPEELTREQAIETVAGALSRLTDLAERRGVTVCMETHDDWCDPSHVAAVLDRVDHPRVACNWDVMHPVRTGKATMDEAFETLRKHIRHVHFHDGTAGEMELRPVGEGVCDHRRVVALLRGAGYDGFLSGEWINWTPWNEHLPRELATMKRYERELGD